MGQDVQNFIQQWLHNNINVEPYQNGDRARSRALAGELRAAARNNGITNRKLSAAAKEMSNDSLQGLVAAAMENATDAEVQRRAARDD